MKLFIFLSGLFIVLYILDLFGIGRYILVDNLYPVNEGLVLLIIALLIVGWFRHGK